MPSILSGKSSLAVILSLLYCLLCWSDIEGMILTQMFSLFIVSTTCHRILEFSIRCLPSYGGQEINMNLVYLSWIYSYVGLDEVLAWPHFGSKLQKTWLANPVVQLLDLVSTDKKQRSMKSQLWVKWIEKRIVVVNSYNIGDQDWEFGSNSKRSINESMH